MKRTYNHLFLTLAFCLCSLFTWAQADCSSVAVATGSGYSICAGETIPAGAGIVFATDAECPAAGGVTESVANDAVVAIPDNTGAQDGCTTVDVTAAGPIASVIVELDITHTWAGDLVAEVTSPSGTTVSLVDRIGYAGTGFGCAGDDLALVFDDAAAATAADLEATCGNAPAAAGPYQSIDLLSLFAGEEASGTWTLCVGDYAGGDLGEITGFGVTVTTAGGVPTPASAVLLDETGTVVSATSPFDPVAAGYTESTTFFAASACPDCNSALTPLEFIVEGGISLACKSNLNVSLDENCSALITPEVYLVAADFDEASYEVTVTDADGNVVEDALITGKGEYTVSVEHLCSGNSCWGYLTAEDKFAPTLECPSARVVSCYEDPKPSFPADYPAAFDNCGISPSPETITYTESDCIAAGSTLADGFTGLFAPANWSLLTGGDATISATDDELTLTTAEFGAQFAEASIIAPFAGEICFDYTYTNNDPGFDLFLSATILASDGSQVNYVVEFADAAGSACVPVLVGDLFGLVVFGDGVANPTFPDDSEAVISNITYTNDEEICENDPCAAVQTKSYIFTAVDDCGNVSETCASPVLILRPSIDDIVFPADIELECTGSDSADPADLEALSTLSGADVYPSIDDQVFELGAKICNYAVTYTDSNPIDLCGNTYKIIRTWSIVDWCGDEVRTDLQVIKFTDNIAPSITCPGSVEVPANYTSCDATVQIQAPEYVEACSSPVTFDITLPDGSAGFVGQNISISAGADYVITFTATDACGNTSDACTQTYTIVDETAPVAVCDQFTVASLGTNGNAHVCATTIDDGSYDNCEDDLVIKVKRMDASNNVNFEDCVEFDCDDTDGPIIVRMRVYDITGNFKENDTAARYSECMVEVEVQDKIDPVITCPPNKVVDCMASTHPDATGYATGYDNCDDVNIIYTDNAQIDDCGEGTIFRSWSIEGTSIKCTQRITIERADNQFFTGDDVNGDDDDIIWPTNVTLTCDSNNSNGSQTDPTEEGAGYPYLVGTDDDCANLFIGHNDQILYDDPEACFKIVRTWKVIDWCQYEPNEEYSAGYWERIQIIKIYDNTAPVITACADVLLGDDDGSCSEHYDLTISAEDNCSTLEYDYHVDLDSDGTYDFSGSGLNDSYNFDLGTHTIHWIVTDDCDNTVECSHEVKVVDTKKPTPVCIVSLSTVVMPSSGTITIWDNDFESGSSFDDCSNPIQFAINAIGDGSGLLNAPPTDNQGNLIHGVTFSCDDLGEQLVQLWVIDGVGNYDYCVTSIFIQNTGACDGGPQPNVANVSGVIETEMQEEVEEVMVDISGGAGNPFMTSNSGLYEFLNLPVDNNYVLTPEKDVNPLNGVTTYDLVLISQHILGAQLLDSPYKIIAADANNSGSVTTLDLVNIRRVILNIDSQFSGNTSWRFVDMDFVFPNPANPFQTTFPEVISLNNFNNDEMAADFVGVKIGDVNASATPNNLLGSVTRNTNGTLALNVNDAKIAAGDEFTVDFTANDFANILGYQFTLNFDQDAVEFVNVEAGKLNVNDSNFGLSMTKDGMISTSWNDASAITAKDGEVLFSMTFKANTNVQLSNILSATSNVTRAEAYNSDADLLDVVIEFNTEEGTVVAGGAFELFQNVPNPVKDATVISFNLPTASAATLTIMDVSGRTLKVLNGDFAQGYNEVTVDRNELKGTGVLYYQLDTPTDTASNKMILVD